MSISFVVDAVKGIAFLKEVHDITEREMTIKKSRRKIVTRSPKRKVGIINCRWFQNEPIEHESQLEKRFIQCALLCPGVLRIKSQPFTMQWDGRIYTPDFLISFLDGKSLVVEVKISRNIAFYLDTFKRVQERLSGSHEFFVLTEKIIDRFSQPEVAAQILRYGKSEFPTEMLQRVLDTGRELGFPYLSISSLASASKAPQEAVLHLLARRCLTLHQDDFVNAEGRVFLSRTTVEDASKIFSSHFDVSPWDSNEFIRPMYRKKAQRMRKRAAVTYLPLVRQRIEDSPKPTAGPLSSLAGGLPVTVRKRRPGATY